MTEIILTLESGTLSRLQDEIMEMRSVRDSFDIIEVRGDYFKDVNTLVRAISMIRDSIDKPILYTYRTEKDGGQGDLLGEDYLYHLATIQKSIPVDYIDVEILQQSDPTIIEQLKRYSKVILSHHDFNGTPSDAVMTGIIDEMTAAKGDFYKIAYMPQTPEDVARVVAVLEQSKEKFGDVVTAISMGELGRKTRTSVAYPSRFTYGTLNEPQAPGQVNVEKLREIYGGTK